MEFYIILWESFGIPKETLWKAIVKSYGNLGELLREAYENPMESYAIPKEILGTL